MMNQFRYLNIVLISLALTIDRNLDTAENREKSLKT